jgi:hypothetical protein
MAGEERAKAKVTRLRTAILILKEGYNVLEGNKKEGKDREKRLTTDACN